LDDLVDSIVEVVPFEIEDVHMDDSALDAVALMVDVQSMVGVAVAAVVVVEDASSFVDFDT
jgi:hypothetical protein